MSVNLDVTSFDNAKALGRKGCVCGGGTDPFRSRTEIRLNVSALVFQFVAMWFTVVSLAEVAREDTDSAIGVPEFVLVTCAAGVMQSLFGPQPLIVLRPTGPVVLVCVQLWNLSKRIYPDGRDAEPDVIIDRYLAFTAVVAGFVGFFMAIISALELSRFCRYFTRFTLEIFETYVGGVTFSLGAQRIVSKFQRPFVPDGEEQWRFGDALFSCALSVATFACAFVFSRASQGKFLNPWLR
jgi:hypothetical protein